MGTLTRVRDVIADLQNFDSDAPVYVEFERKNKKDYEDFPNFKYNENGDVIISVHLWR